MAVSKDKQSLPQISDTNRLKHLAADVDAFGNDYIIRSDDTNITLLGYGSYASFASAAAYEVVASLHTRFGDETRYVFRHLPAHDNNTARNAAIVAEYLWHQSIDFWGVHNEFTVHGDDLERERINRLVTEEFGLDLSASKIDSRWSQAVNKVNTDLETARRSGAFISPTFFINRRRYEGPWDENPLAEAMLETPGHRLRWATVDFVRWGPSSGIALLTMVLLASILANSPVGERFEALWQTPLGFQLANGTFELSLPKWINDGLLTFFFLVVGLEIKREFSVGRLSIRRAVMLPLAAATGGIIPALLYVLVVPSGYLTMGWGTTISTDTAFAIALIVILGKRVPIELRVFLTASVIIDDLAGILIVAAFYTNEIQSSYLGVSVIVTLMLIILNRSRFYRPLPYALLGLVLWLVLHEAGIHATLSGVILALFIPTRPPANLRALDIQTQVILRTEAAFNKNFEHHRPSHRALALERSFSGDKRRLMNYERNV